MVLQPHKSGVVDPAAILPKESPMPEKIDEGLDGGIDATNADAETLASMVNQYFE